MLAVDSSLAGKTVEIKPWTFTYVFKTSPSRDPDKNSPGTDGSIALSVNGEGGDYGSRDELKFVATYGTDNAKLSYYNASAIGMVTANADTYNTIVVDGKRLTVEFKCWTTDPEGKYPVDINSYVPDVKSNGTILATLYAQWRPLRIVITDFATDDGGKGMTGLTYIKPDDKTMISVSEEGQYARYTPYIREGDNLNITGTPGKYTVTIYATDINNPFLKFSTTYSKNLVNKTYTYEDLVARNWVIQGKTQQSRYLPIPSDNGGDNKAKVAVYLTVNDLDHN